MSDEAPTPVYANVVNVTAGPYDLVMDFGFKSPEELQRKSPDYVIVTRVAMSLAHAKTMIPVLAGIVANYEEQFGKIPAPGFEDKSKQ